MSSVDRRTFLKGMAAAAGSSALLPAAGLHANARALAWRGAACPLCPVGCGLLVGIENGRAVAVKGDVDSPVSKGLACAKGYHAVQALYARDRITRARIRRNGALVEVPLEEALALTARQLRDTSAQHGADSVALYGPAQWQTADAQLAHTLFAATLGARFIDGEDRVEGGSGGAGLIASFGDDGPVACYDDVEHADTIILWNQNLAETHPVLFSRILTRRRTNPAVRVIDLGTRTTRTSYAADRALLYAPQTELALAHAIAHGLVQKRLVHRDFIARYVGFRSGSEGNALPAAGVLAADAVAERTWSDYVRFLSTYTTSYAQRITGMHAAEIDWLASLYGDRSRRVLSIWGAGVGRHVRGTWVNNALYNLHLLTGRIATPGNGALCVDVQPRAGAAPGSVLPMLRALDRGDIRFLWIQSADPFTSLPNLSRYRAAARREGRFIVVSEAFPTPATDLADVVLPTALWIEQELSARNAEGRVQHSEQLLRAPGDGRSLRVQLLDIARRLGHGTLPDARDTAPPSFLRWRYHTTHDAAAARTRGDFDFYAHPDHRAWIWLRPHEAVAEQPTREYPHVLAIGSVLEHTGTGAFTRRIPSLHRAVPHTYAELNGDDARALGVRSGDRVRLVSRRGSLTLEARVELRSQPPRGQVFVPLFDEAHAVNVLMPDACCPLSGQPANGYCAIRVERVRGES